jgi:HPt (histidine-containing phosphotransfer) domain-containing protein
VAAGVDQIVAKPAHWPTLFEAIETRGLIFHTDSNLAPALRAPPPVAKTLDETALSALENAIGGAALARMLGTFRESVARYDEELKAALAAEDLTAARRAGHALKGTSLQFGAMELAGIGSEIERAAALDDAQRAVTGIPPALACLDIALSVRARAKRDALN